MFSLAPPAVAPTRSPRFRRLSVLPAPEMLDFCGKHSISCDIELIKIQQFNEAYERMIGSDVKYRFVIDLASLKG